MYPITRKSPLLLAAAAISIAMAGTASAQWRITRPGSYKLYFNVAFFSYLFSAVLKIFIVIKNANIIS